MIGRSIYRMKTASVTTVVKRSKSSLAHLNPKQLKNLDIHPKATTVLHKPDFQNQAEEDAFVKTVIDSFISNKQENKENSLENDALRQLFHNWNLSSENYLPMTKPNNVSTPFEFFKTHNSDISMMKFPRLSVTKLLVSGWCELRDYYRIYAGSPAFEKSEAMVSGSKYHVRLEEQTHEKIELGPALLSYVKNNIDEIRKMDGLEGEKMSGEDELAQTWCDQLLYRLFSLITRTEAREILVHGYLNLGESNFVNNSNQVADQSNILVSGIIDHINIRNLDRWDDVTLFQRIRQYMNSSDVIDDAMILDLPQFFKTIPSLIDNYGDAYTLSISDVKTRKFPNLPKQESILESAKLQTFYYKYFFQLLSNDGEFAYNSLIENAKRRGLDVDKPLSVFTVFKILLNFYPLVLKDFIRLSKGEPIEFDSYDDIVRDDKYEFGKYFNSIENHCKGAVDHKSFIEQLKKMDPINFEKILHPLLKEWTQPPTLRYIAARASEFFQLFNQFESNTTFVEYHYLKTGRPIETKAFQYNKDEMDVEIASTSSFFEGARDPIPTTDKSKCKFCDFKTKCKIGSDTYNGEDTPLNNGLKIVQFLNTIEKEA